jgi:hypothetical protein
MVLGDGWVLAPVRYDHQRMPDAWSVEIDSAEAMDRMLAAGVAVPSLTNSWNHVILEVTVDVDRLDLWLRQEVGVMSFDHDCQRAVDRGAQWFRWQHHVWLRHEADAMITTLRWL